jgi:quinol monooxygenase YgiN
VFTTTARFNVQPGKEAEAEAAMTSLAEQVAANEPGALTYLWHRNRKEPNQILVFEVYKDEAAVEQHRTSQYLADFQKHFGPVFDPASVKIERFERFAGVNR